MTTTLEKYNKLCDMELINKSKYDINDRVQLIIEEVQMQLKQWEDEARKMYGMEKSSTISETNPSSLMKNGK